MFLTFFLGKQNKMLCTKGFCSSSRFRIFLLVATSAYRRTVFAHEMIIFVCQNDGSRALVVFVLLYRFPFVPRATLVVA